MIRRALIVLCLTAALAISLACGLPGPGAASRRTVRGSGDVVDHERDVGDFTSVSLDTIGTLYITAGDEASLRISAENNILDLIETDVRDGTLTIRTQRDVSLRPTKPVVYNLTVIELDEVALTSSGNADVGDLQADRFTIRIASSGDFTMTDLTCQEFDVRSSSSGNVTIGSATGDALDVELNSSGNLTINDGAFEHQFIRLSSSGDYDARHVRTSVADLRLNSSGSATVWVEENLTARLSSSGNVRYAGRPDLTWDATSSGGVKPLND